MTLPADGVVLPTRASISLPELYIGEPVRSATMLRMGRLAHWVRGRGRVLVPSHAPMTLVAGLTSETLRYYARPSGVAISRVWLAEVKADTTGCLFTMQAGAGVTSATYDAWGAGGATGAYFSGGIYLYIETPVTKTTSARRATNSSFSASR